MVPVVSGLVADDFILYLPRFEGPLDLLVYLIEKNRFTLEDLEVCPVINQYLEYIHKIRSLNIELAGEFLDMASYLIWTKSCMLLPVIQGPMEEGGGDPAGDLKEMLREYMAVRHAAEALGRMPRLYSDRFPRGGSPGEDVLSPMNMGALMQAVHAIRMRTRKYVIRTAGPKISLRAMMARLHAMLDKHSKIALSEVIGKRPDRGEKIAAFLAALELSRSALAGIIQEALFSEIYLVKRAPSKRG